MNASLTQHSTYRPEIDGLRAIAVLGVVLFHAELGVRGGYVGVDVFFVISGFLITGIIARSLHEGTFQLSDFFTRRIKRILPASVMMITIVAIAGAILLVPSDFERLMRAALWNSALLANFHFSQQTGYFAEHSELQPLLHCWSLAVEEQFYLIFPAFMLLLHKFSRRHMFAMVCLVGLLSLSFCIWQTQHNQTYAFYLLPSRAWELAAGAALALAPIKSISRTWSSVLSVGGALAIAYALFFFDTGTSFPGAWALLPVGGSVAVIAGTAHHANGIRRLLASKPLVAVGAISYSIYLWHWPLLAFANLLMTDVSFMMRVMLAIASIALAIPSYYLVEQPFRRGVLISTPRRAWQFAFATAGVIVTASALTDLGDGFASRIPAELQPYLHDVTWTGEEYSVGAGNSPVKIGRVTSEAPPDFVLWGDSHARMSAVGFDEVGKALGLSGSVYAVSGMPPVPGVWKYGDRRSDIETSLEECQAMQQNVLNSNTKAVILVSRWTAFCVGHNDAEVAAGTKRTRSLVVDEHTATPPPPEVAAETLRRHLVDLLKQFQSRGISVWIIHQCPECESVYPARDFLKWKMYPSLYADGHLDKAKVSLTQHMQRQKHPRWIFKSLEGTGVELIDPTPAFFDERGLLRLRAERSYYRDNDHLTRTGVRELLQPYIVDVLSQVKERTQTEAHMHAKRQERPSHRSWNASATGSGSS